MPDLLAARAATKRITQCRPNVDWPSKDVELEHIKLFRTYLRSVFAVGVYPLKGICEGTNIACSLPDELEAEIVAWKEAHNLFFLNRQFIRWHVQAEYCWKELSEGGIGRGLYEPIMLIFESGGRITEAEHEYVSFGRISISYLRLPSEHRD